MLFHTHFKDEQVPHVWHRGEYYPIAIQLIVRPVRIAYSCIPYTPRTCTPSIVQAL
jgi:hypothetical protein